MRTTATNEDVQKLDTPPPYIVGASEPEVGVISSTEIVQSSPPQHPPKHAKKRTSGAKVLQLVANSAPPEVEEQTCKGKGESFQILLGFARRELMFGHFPCAEELYREAVVKIPNSPEPWGGLGWTLGRLHKYEESIDAFQKALEVSPRYGDALIGLGNIYRVTGNEQKAREVYSKYLELNPNGLSASIARNALHFLLQ